MKSVCLVYDVPFKGPLEAEEQSGEDKFEGVQAVMCNPPYSTCRIAELSNSQHDGLRLQDMSHIVEAHSEVMYVGVHEHLFCSTLQFQVR